MDPYPFPPHVTLHMTLRQASQKEQHDLELRSCQQTVHFSFHYLVTILLLGQNMRSLDLPIYISDISPSSCYDFLS